MGSSWAAVGGWPWSEGGGQEQGEPAPPAEVALDGEFAADLTGQPPRDRQAQSETFPTVSLTIVYLDEVVEDVFLVFGCDPHAGVRDVNRHPGRTDVHTEIHGPSMGEFDRIVDEVDQDPLQFDPIGRDRHAVRRGAH